MTILVPAVLPAKNAHTKEGGCRRRLRNGVIGMDRPAEDCRGATLIERLRDLRYCAKYLSASSRESAETFLAAIRNVVEAQTLLLAVLK